MASFEERIAALEERDAAGLRLRDLPLAALQRKLEADWRPSPASLFGDVLPQFGFAFGTASIAFTGTANAPVVTALHGLGSVPRFVTVFYDADPASTSLFVFPYSDITTTSFDIAGKCSVATAATVAVGWLAIK